MRSPEGNVPSHQINDGLIRVGCGPMELHQRKSVCGNVNAVSLRRRMRRMVVGVYPCPKIYRVAYNRGEALVTLSVFTTARVDLRE
jgi:hypothetical protein